MTHVVFRRMLALLALIAVAFPVVGYVQPAVNQAALVVRFDNGRVEKACVEFTEPEITGVQLLERSNIPFIAQSTGMGAAVCQIDGEGCAYPTQDCFCKSPPDYWALYRMIGGSWAVSGAGASTTKIRNGDVQGWAWGSGSIAQESRPPDVDFASICTIPATEPTSAPGQAATPRPSTTEAPPTAEPTATSAPTRVPPVASPRPPPTRTFFPPTATPRPTRAPMVATATAQPRPSATREQVAPTVAPATQTVPTAMQHNPTATPLPPTATVRELAPTPTTRTLPSPTRVVPSPTHTPQPEIAPTAMVLPPPTMALPPTDIPLPPPTMALPPTDIPLAPPVTTDAAFGFSQQTTPVIITGASVVAETSVVASPNVLETAIAATMTVNPALTATSTREVRTVVVVMETAPPSPSPLLIAGGDNASPPMTPGEAGASLPLDPLVFIGVCAVLVAIIVKLRRRQRTND